MTQKLFNDKRQSAKQHCRVAEEAVKVSKGYITDADDETSRYLERAKINLETAVASCEAALRELAEIDNPNFGKETPAT